MIAGNRTPWGPEAIIDRGDRQTAIMFRAHEEFFSHVSDDSSVNQQRRAAVMSDMDSQDLHASEIISSGEPNSTEIGRVSAAVQHWKNEHDWRATKYRCRDITDLLERGPHRAHPRPESKSIAASAASGIVASCCWFNERLPFRTDIFFPL